MRSPENSLKMLIWFALVFGCSRASKFIRYHRLVDTNVQVFEKGFPDIRKIFAETFKKQTGNKDLIDTATTKISLKIQEIPKSFQLFNNILKDSLQLLETKSDWKDDMIKVLETINENGDNSKTAISIDFIESQLKFLHDYTDELIDLLKKQKNNENKNSNHRDANVYSRNHFDKEQTTKDKDGERIPRLITAKKEIIKSTLRQMLVHFEKEAYKKFALVTAPLLIEIASLFAFFAQTVKEIIPDEWDDDDDGKLACNAYDLLLSYRPRAVFARAEKLSLKYVYYVLITNTLAMPYDPMGYTGNNAFLNCEPGCEEPFKKEFCSETCPTFFCTPTCHEEGFDEYANCIVDSLGSKVYKYSDIQLLHSDQGIQQVYCASEYVKLIRHRVEKMFPVESLKDLCHRKPRRTTGYGHLTFKLGIMVILGTNKGLFCLNNNCEPFMHLIINGELVKEKKIEKKTGKHFIYDADYVYTSKLIRNDSTIKVEIWDDASLWVGLDNLISNYDNKSLIFSTEGNITSFMEKPLRLGAEYWWTNNIHYKNTMNTYTFWEDEYEDVPEEEYEANTFGGNNVSLPKWRSDDWLRKIMADPRTVEEINRLSGIWKKK